MARPRNIENDDLPEYLYGRFNKKLKKTYYVYFDPISKKEISVGTDKASAILDATTRNRKNEEVIRAHRCGVTLQNGIPAITSGAIDDDGLFTRKTIINAARSVDRICGIYFLIAVGNIVYVGKSKDIILRLSNHMREGRKVFDSFCVLKCAPEELDTLEALYIAKLRPSLNTQRPALIQTEWKNAGRIPEKVSN